MRIDVTPERKYWVVEAGPCVITPEPMPMGRRDWAPVRFAAVFLSRGASVNEALKMARSVAADREVLAITWAEYCHAREIGDTLWRVDSEFVTGPDPRD